MRYIARRHIDFFRPGDEVPEGYYDPATLARLIEKGVVEAVEEVVDVSPEPVTDVGAQTPPVLPAARKSGKKQRL